MRWIVDRGVREDAAGALEWVRAFLAGYDTSRVEWIRIDRGRGRFGGVYGRCWYPTRRKRTYRLSCQVPGPFPGTIQTRRPPRYLHDPRELAPDEFVAGAARDGRTGRAWEQVRARTAVRDTGEAIVWIVAHEAFHFLRRTRQVPGRNVESEADAFADGVLRRFREEAAPAPNSLTGAALYGRGRGWEPGGSRGRLLVVMGPAATEDMWWVWMEDAPASTARGHSIRPALLEGYRPPDRGPAEADHLGIAVALLLYARDERYCDDLDARAAALALVDRHLRAAAGR